MIKLAGNITTGPAVPAVSLYNGALYNRCPESMGAVASGRYPEIELLIVSAHYGLVRPAEPIADYDLRMDDEVAGVKVYRLWKQLGVGAVLEDYARRQEITHVWSLLASQYRKALNPFWKITPSKTIWISSLILPLDSRSEGQRSLSLQKYTHH